MHKQNESLSISNEKDVVQIENLSKRIPYFFFVLGFLMLGVSFSLENYNTLAYFFDHSLQYARNIKYTIDLFNFLYELAYSLSIAAVVLILLYAAVSRRNLRKSDYLGIFLLLAFVVQTLPTTLIYPLNSVYQNIGAYPLYPLSFRFSQSAMGIDWWGSWIGSIILYAGIFLSIAFAVFFIGKVSRYGRLGQIYVVLVFISTILAIAGNFPSPLAYAAEAYGANSTIVIMDNIISLLSTTTTAVIPVAIVLISAVWKMHYLHIS